MINIKEIRERLKLLDGNVATLMSESNSFYIHTPEIEYMLDLIDQLKEQLAESVESTIKLAFEKECLEGKLKIADKALHSVEFADDNSECVYSVEMERALDDVVIALAQIRGEE